MPVARDAAAGPAADIAYVLAPLKHSPWLDYMVEKAVEMGGQQGCQPVLTRHTPRSRASTPKGAKADIASPMTSRPPS
jgi:hypothetical protein